MNIAVNGIALANHPAKLTKRSSHLGLPSLRPVVLEHSYLYVHLSVRWGKESLRLMFDSHKKYGTKCKKEFRFN